MSSKTEDNIHGKDGLYQKHVEDSPAKHKIKQILQTKTTKKTLQNNTDTCINGEQLQYEQEVGNL